MSKTLRSTLMENPWFLSKPLVFHGTIPDTNDLTSDSSSSMSKTFRSTLYGKFMVSLKTSGFPWNHTRYQLSDLRFELLDVENPSVNPYGKFMVSLKTSGFSWNHTRYQRSDLRC